MYNVQCTFNQVYQVFEKLCFLAVSMAFIVMLLVSEQL